MFCSSSAHRAKAWGTGICHMNILSPYPASHFDSQPAFLSPHLFSRWRHKASVQHWKWNSPGSNIFSLNCSSLKADIHNKKTWWINATAKYTCGLAGFIQVPLALTTKPYVLKSISHSAFWMSPWSPTLCEGLLYPTVPDVAGWPSKAVLWSQSRISQFNFLTAESDHSQWAWPQSLAIIKVLFIAQ